MLRSLLIGFMILSALTSKGAEVQIFKSDLTISADMLLEFFNTVTVQNSKAAELLAAKADGSYVQIQLCRLRQTGPIALLKQSGQTDHDLKSVPVFLKPVSSDGPHALFCVSGLSPPIVDA